MAAGLVSWWESDSGERSAEIEPSAFLGSSRVNYAVNCFPDMPWWSSPNGIQLHNPLPA